MVAPVIIPARNIGSSEICRALLIHCSDFGKVGSVDGDGEQGVSVEESSIGSISIMMAPFT